MSRSTGILCDWLNNSQTRYSPIRVFPQQLSNRQIGSSSNIKLRVQEGLNELGIVLLCLVRKAEQIRVILCYGGEQLIQKINTNTKYDI